MHYVDGSRIRDSATGKEVAWRGVGFCYLHNDVINYIAGWNNYIPTMKAMGLNTARLAFMFPFDPASSESIMLDYAKMDAVVDLLAENGVKSILDHHGAYNPNVMLDPRLTTSWVELATHYAGNENIVAYELYNEPAVGASTMQQNAQAYHDLTLAVNAVEEAVVGSAPKHICVWESPAYYIPQFEKIEDLMLPNVVYTKHAWWTTNQDEIITYGAEETSRRSLDQHMFWRDKYNIPVWLGEYGGPNGGNPTTLFDPTDNFWAIVDQLTRRAEEQAMGWNLWLGLVRYPEIDHLINTAAMFPLNYLNSKFIRQSWIPCQQPTLYRYIIASNVDSLSQFSIATWHNNDFVTLKAGIIVDVKRDHLIGGVVVDTKTERLYLTEDTTITNHEGTTAYPGDWNMYIYSIGRVPPPSIPLWTWPLLTWLRNLLAGQGRLENAL